METGSKYSSTGAYGGIESGVPVANKRKMRGWDVILRFLALALSLVAAVVIGVNKQTTTVAVPMGPMLPTMNVPVMAKWHYLSAFVFLVVANIIACSYAAISILVTLANRNGKKGITMMIVLLDLVIVALLFSSVGAACAIGLMGYRGNSHVQWKKVCNVFDKYCNQAAVGIGLSGGASFVFFVLVALATLNLLKKH